MEYVTCIICVDPIIAFFLQAASNGLVSNYS